MENIYVHIDFDERKMIEALFNHGETYRYIADVIGRGLGTISDEINRNKVKGEYRAVKAQMKAYGKQYRKKKDCLAVPMDDFIHSYVLKGLEDKISPERISGDLEKHHHIKISFKAIYKFVHKRDLEDRLFWGWNKRKRGPRGVKWGYKKDPDKIYIFDRPEVTFGDFEGDFIVSKKDKSVLFVLVDIKTGYTVVYPLPNRKKRAVYGALKKAFSTLNIKSLTLDNDIGFQHWKKWQKKFNTKIYFTTPYRWWEKARVEGTNKIIRCFIPKKSDISKVSKETFEEIDRYINHLPRQMLEYETSYKVALSSGIIKIN